MKKTTFIYILLVLLIHQISLAQMTGGNTVSPNPNTLLHVFENTSSLGKGFLTPRFSSTQRNSIPAGSTEDGLLIYNTTENCFNYWKYNASTSSGLWVSLCNGCMLPDLAIVYPKCNAAILSNSSGNLILGEAASGTINVPITVSTPGIMNAIYEVQNGVTFSMPQQNVTTATTSITINYTGTPVSATNINLPIKDTNGVVMCTITIPVVYGNGVYTCTSATVVGNYTVRTPLNSTNYATVTLNVTVPGYVSIQTNPLSSAGENGIKFGVTDYFIATTGIHNVTLPSIAATDPYPMTAEEVSNGANGGNNQSGSYNFRNLKNNSILGCSIAFDVKPQQITVTGLATAVGDWNTVGTVRNGANDGIIQLYLTTKYYGTLNSNNGTSQFWNVPVRNVSTSNITYSFRSSSYFDAYTLINAGTLASGASIPSIDPYNPYATRVGAASNLDNGAHAGNYFGGQEESEAGLTVNYNGKWYKYRIIFDTTSAGTATYIILYGIYNTEPAKYQTTTTYLSKSNNPQSYWP